MSANKSSADATVLERLFATVADRRDADPDTSYTAQLLAAGPARAAQKMGEEAVETVIAAAAGKRGQVISESADLLYHLIVLWASTGVVPSEVWAMLESREGKSGLAEKAARKGKS